jgi:hypothetical protein
MSQRNVRVGLALGLVMAPLALLTGACSRSEEKPYLTQFFRAAKARDNATLAMMSAVEFDTREKGEVTSFDITSVGEEKRTPLDFKALIDAERKAIADEADFRKRKLEYQNANLPALETIVKMERDPSSKFTPAQQKMKSEWDKWREDTTAFQKATTAAKNAVTAQTGPAEASLTQPGQPPFAPDKFQGELLTKEVTLNAKIRMPDGQESTKTLVVTIQRVTGTMDGTARTGRSIITKIQGL